MVSVCVCHRFFIIIIYGTYSSVTWRSAHVEQKILVKDHSCEIIEGNLPEYKLHTVFIGTA